MTDSFLQSMTFSKSGMFLNAYDCEECDDVPPSIRKFIQDRKRHRMVTAPIKRTQQRTLVCRHGQISLWCMHMPRNAEPLIEFGNSHMIVWVKQFTSRVNTNDYNSSILRWIGQGIIGSSDEEKSRKKMIEWAEGNVFLIPSNGGKAIGWIHASDDYNSTNTATNNIDETGIAVNKGKKEKSGGLIILYVAKIPSGILEQEPKESDHRWTNQLIECCRDGLKLCGKPFDKSPFYYKFSTEASKLLKKAIHEAEGMTARSDVIERASKRICLNHQGT